MSWVALAAAVVGGIAAAQKKNQSESRDLGTASELETRSGQVSLDSLNQLQEMIARGPGAQDVQAGADSQRDLARLIKELQGNGGMPNDQDTARAGDFADRAFAGQRNSLTNTFEDQRVQASRAQARTGRGSFDPILQNKLAQEQTRQSGQLAANQGSFAAQYAQQLPNQRLQLAQQFAGVQSGLASQAMSNRQALLGLGQQLRSGDQNFRAGTATTTQSSGGGFQGFLTGALGGGAMGMNAMNAFGGGGGGYGGIGSGEGGSNNSRGPGGGGGSAGYGGSTRGGGGPRFISGM